MSSNSEDVSRIITGDMRGNVLIFSFHKSGGKEGDERGSRGPFSFRSGEDVKVLFYDRIRKLVSVGNDSAIMVWDIWTGKCTSLITDAHTQMEHGTAVKVEITAAAFAPVSQQLLVTGARDGSLKVWNFTSGECIRHMSIERNWCNWKSRNKSDFLGDYKGKCWETRHTEELVCAVAYPPHMLATASYNGELVLWRIETAQAHRRYHVANPTSRFSLDFKKHEQSREDNTNLMSFPSRVSVTSASSISTVSRQKRGITDKTKKVWCHILQNSNKVENKDEPKEEHVDKSVVPGQGTGYLGSFSAIHSAGEYIAAMATDEKNEFLFTGDTAGYLKVWLLENFFTDLQTNACIMYRKCFPFLLKDRFDGTAKKAVQKQLFPVLLSSLRAHLRAITCIEYIPEAKIIVSCSSDCSVRLWTLGGCYIGTLGQRHIWPLLEHGEVPENIETRIPPDIARVASFTTIKVLTGGNTEMRDSISENLSDKKFISEETDLVAKVNGKQIDLEQPLGKHFCLPKRSGKIFLPPKLDHTYGEFVPIYSHIMCPELKHEQKPHNLNIHCLQNKDK
ncbi:hypothetical protein J437_LFUL011352 [Ladona fulva]|uniref:WD repeat-containing protein on Y chromosome n=1 Tax=Ladona fulva TaxID=123851 RepID=A0A8K0KEB2_LADFU|nr:hypothetical protein J437_LFUL011352 [Ladona fulva]